MSSTVLSSSNNVIAFEANRPEPEPKGFAQTRSAWLQWRANKELTPFGRALISELSEHINYEHFQNAGELIAWPSWELMAANGLSERSIARGLLKLERLGALEIIHGERDSKTGWKGHNTYRLILPPPAKLAPGHLPGWHKTTCQGGIRLDDLDSMNLRGKNFENGNPRNEGQKESEKKRRQRLGLSEFTGQPLWKRW